MMASFDEVVTGRRLAGVSWCSRVGAEDQGTPPGARCVTGYRLTVTVRIDTGEGA
jgi:hypothetical protein